MEKFTQSSSASSFAWIVYTIGMCILIYNGRIQYDIVIAISGMMLVFISTLDSICANIVNGIKSNESHQTEQIRSIEQLKQAYLRNKNH